VLDGGERLLLALDAVSKNVYESMSYQDGSIEVLLADSGSRDGAVEEAMRRHGATRVFDVAHGRFDHGAVRTALVAAAGAPLVALLSQDAVPLGPDYLATLASPFRDPTVAGSFARQVPRPGADPLLRATLARWTPPGCRPSFRRLAAGQRLDALPPAERMAFCRFDNVASMVRREIVAGAWPFPPRPFGEDLAWGSAVLAAGFTLAYVPAAEVEHHHEPTLAATFRRNRVAHRQAAAEFGLHAVPSLAGVGLSMLAGLPGDLRDGGPLWALRGLPRRAAALLGQWAGGRQGVPGR
jgi:GT2 family glycosyltransferase